MKEHGHFDMKIVGQTLIVTCFDSWNIETTIRLSNEYTQLVEKINNAPWACLVDLSQWELSTPDGWDEINKLNQWANINNQGYEVVVCNTALKKSLMKNSHKVLTNVETFFCNDLDSAYQWLNTKGLLNTLK